MPNKQPLNSENINQSQLIIYQTEDHQTKLDDERLKNPDQPFDYFEELTRRICMTMVDWVKKLDGFLTLNDRNILDHAGKVSHQMAKELAEQEYEKFHQQYLDNEAAQADEVFESLASASHDIRKRGRS